VNEGWVVLLAVASLGLLSCGLLVAAWTRQRLGVVATVLLALALGVWALDLLAVTSGYGDADGFVDCGDFCTTTQRVAAVGFVAPPLLVALAAGGVLVALIARVRRKRRVA
jgi:hypothetical protein